MYLRGVYSIFFNQCNLKNFLSKVKYHVSVASFSMISITRDQQSLAVISAVVQRDSYAW